LGVLLRMKTTKMPCPDDSDAKRPGPGVKRLSFQLDPAFAVRRQAPIAL